MAPRALTALLAAFLITQRLLELRHARANERWAREHGAREYGREHYPLFFLLHGAWLASLVGEGRRATGRPGWAWLAAFALAQPLRYWVIRTLGRQWNTRILIVPGARRITGGPFRYLRHPNYVVVATEILSAPLAVRAWRTALAFSVLNALLLLRVRIPTEEKALQAYQHEHQHTPT